MKQSFLSLCLVFLLINLSSAQSKKNYQNIVLKIGNVEITQYEFERNLNKAKQQHNKGDNDSSNFDLNGWIEDFIDKTYLLAEAVEMGYGENADINKMVNNLARYMLTTHRGELQEYLVNKNISIADVDIKYAYEKRGTVFLIEYLTFSSAEVADSITSEFAALNAETFEILKNNLEDDVEEESCSCKKNLKYGEHALIPPSTFLWDMEQTIANMKVGEIIGPLETSNGVSIIRLKEIQNYEKKPFEEEEQILRRIIERREKSKLSYNRLTAIKKQAQSKINHEVVDKILKVTEQLENKSRFDKEKFREISNEVLLTYNLNSQNINVTVYDFIDYYQRQPLIKPLAGSDIIISYAEEIPIEEYEYREAVSLDLNKGEKFLLDKKDYKNRVITRQFEKDILIPQVSIAEDELAALYEERVSNSNFIEPQEITASIFTFKTRGDAHFGKNNLEEIDSLTEEILQENLKNKERFLEGLIEYSLHEKINHETEIFPKRYVSRIFMLKDGEYMDFTLRDENKNYVIKKEQEFGSRIKTFEEVKDILEKQLHKEKLEKIKKETLTQLKKKFTIDNRIDNDYYLSSK